MSIDLSLDRLRAVLRYLPPYTRPTIHIAGTNGKGSVTAILSSIFIAADPPLSVGRFNSPHLVTIYDSIVVNGEMVSAEDYASARGLVEEANLKHEAPLTNFELLTATALMVFQRAKVDIAVIEAGLGGRLDATNVIPDQCVCISALTTVGLDHQSFLGDTPAAIAGEKAAIARVDKPFILGKQEYPEVETVVEAVVKGVGSFLIKAVQVSERDWDPEIDGERPSYFHLSPDDFKAPPGQPVSLNMQCFPTPIRALLPLYGTHQLDNLSVASTIVSALLTQPSCAPLNLKNRVTPESVAHGVRTVQWPGRLAFHRFSFGRHNRRMVALVDGAHNSGSAATLSSYISNLLYHMRPKSSSHTTLHLTYILALSHSPPKTPFQTLSPLLPPRISGAEVTFDISVNVAAVPFSPPEGMPWVKSVALEQIREAARTLAPDANVWNVDRDDLRLEDALEWASGLPTLEEGAQCLVVIAGSLYLVADFYRLIRSQGSLGAASVCV